MRLCINVPNVLVEEERQRASGRELKDGENGGGILEEEQP